MTVPAAEPGRFPMLIPAAAIASRVAELARAIAAQPWPEPPLLLVVAEGACTFARALASALPWPVPSVPIHAKSYGDRLTSSGQVRIDGLDDAVVRGRDVIVVEDIIDTGRTVARILDELRRCGVRSASVAALLSKPSRRVVAGRIDWLGFEVPDLFVIGYGMDVAGRWRELPDVVVYDPA